MDPKRTLVLLLALLAAPAEARFGKSGSASAPSASHRAVPASPGGGRGGGTTPSPGRWGVGPPARGWFSGGYLPGYGYGYGYGYGWFAPYGILAPAPVLLAPAPAPAPTEEVGVGLRVTAGALVSLYLAGEPGLAVGVHGLIEGERWGVFLAGQNLAAKAQDGTGAVDNLQQAQLRLTYAFLSGPYGRLRAELGADAVFAPSIVALGPSGGLSGTLWLFGPLALEGSVLVTPYPFWQLDAQAGLALGLGQVGIRAGWRTQLLDDRGLADGVVHRDVFNGPYVGLAVVF